jgi:cytochrome c553
MRLRSLFTTLLLFGASAGFAAAAGDAHAGHAVYDKSCKTCHGTEGQGNPGIAKAMNVTIHDLGSAEVQGKSDAELKKIITEGKGKMRPVKTLSDDQVQNLIAYIRSLAKK